MTGAFSDLPGKSMQKDGATRLIPPASFNWYCFGMLLQQRLEARVVAERVPDGMDPNKRHNPIMRLAVVRPQRHTLARGIAGRRLLVQGQVDSGQGPTVRT